MTYTPSVAQAAAEAQQQRNPQFKTAQEPQHAAATTVEKTVLNDTKAIIEATTGVGRKPVVRIDDPDAVGRRFIEAYPCYSPIGGITFRIDRYDGQPSLWMDATLDEAIEICIDLANVIAEVQKADLPDEPKEAEAGSEDKTSDAKVYNWRKPTGREYVPLTWFVDQWSEERDDVERKGQFPVMNNKQEDVAVWFKDEDLANEMVGRLNEKNRY